MYIKRLILPALLLHQLLSAQVIPSDRRTDWSLAGYRDTIPSYSNTVDITAFGGVGNGITSNNSALQNAIASLNGSSGTIYFPSGNFRFTASVTLRDSIVLKGNSSDSTTLSFNLGGNGDLIRIAGSIASSSASLTANAAKDSTYIIVSNPALFNVGDYLKISQNDSALLFSSWAYGSVGQIIQVNSINGNRINLKSPLRKNFSVSDSCKVKKITPKHDIGIECLKVKRLDASAGQTTSIDINYGVKCWLKGVEMDSCNFAHVAISNSSNIEISGCYIHDAFAFGGSGQGYGIALQYASGECLIENNIFNHLRHSMLLQAGANGNVFGYNSSTNPYWISGFLPANSAGDMVLHGNYVFLNLFEGNQGQNIVIDDSHGTNGPYNTYFRNRADLYGIFMNTNPASNNQNLIGNEVTSTASLQGLYSLAGTGHLAHSNNIKGTIMPSGTNTLSDTSYYKKSLPGFYNSYSVHPNIGIPNIISSGNIPARQRQLQGFNFADCVTNYPFIYWNQYSSVADTFCSGVPYNFNGTTLLTSGTYSDTISTGNNYDSIVILHLTENIIDTAITVNGFTLTSSEPNVSYQWVDCGNNSSVNGATNQSFTPLQGGNYKVIITKGNCIKESGCVNITMTNVQETEKIFFSVQPNPVKDFCTLNLNGNAKITGTVYNVIGEKVLQLFSNEIMRQYTFSTQSLKSGFYFIKVTDVKGRAETQRIIVAK